MNRHAPGGISLRARLAGVALLKCNAVHCLLGVDNVKQEMNPKTNPKTPMTSEKELEEPEIQQGGSRGVAKTEQLKRVVKQHPKREEPKVDSVEPGETPAP